MSFNDGVKDKKNYGKIIVKLFNKCITPLLITSPTHHRTEIKASDPCHRTKVNENALLLLLHNE